MAADYFLKSLCPFANGTESCLLVILLYACSQVDWNYAFGIVMVNTPLWYSIFMLTVLEGPGRVKVRWNWPTKRSRYWYLPLLSAVWSFACSVLIEMLKTWFSTWHLLTAHKHRVHLPSQHSCLVFPVNPRLVICLNCLKGRLYESVKMNHQKDVHFISVTFQIIIKHLHRSKGRAYVQLPLSSL